MLYRPWRDEASELLTGDNHQKFLERGEEIMAAKAEFCKSDDTELDTFLESLMNERRANGDNGDGGGNEGDVAHLDIDNDTRRFTVDVDNTDEGDYHRNADLEEGLNSSGAARSPQTYSEKLSLPNRLSNQDYCQLLATLNPGQRLYLNHIMNRMRYSGEEAVNVMFSAGSASQYIYSPFYCAQNKNTDIPLTTSLPLL